MDQLSDKCAKQFNSNRFYYPHSALQRATVAVSSCLTGQRVRYDGGDRRLDAIEWLASELQLIPICPEVGAGLGVPRPPVRLVADASSAMRARGRDDPNLDVTAPLRNFARISAAQFNAEKTLCGYLWKSRSPSCGYNSAPLFDRSGRQIGSASGIQAEHFLRTLPWLSFCEETDLRDRSAALAFVLRCRIVFDWMYAGSAALLAQHRHYHFLTDRLGRHQQAELARLAATATKADYLTALQRGCARLPAEQLLDLFFN